MQLCMSKTIGGIIYTKIKILDLDIFMLNINDIISNNSKFLPLPVNCC